MATTKGVEILLRDKLAERETQATAIRNAIAVAKPEAEGGAKRPFTDPAHAHWETTIPELQANLAAVEADVAALRADLGLPPAP